MQTRARNPGLDLLRSAAILLVMLWHVPGVAVPEFALRLRRVGWTGVDLFFVLSGYLIGRQLMRAYARGVRPLFGRFYLRRSMRVLPAYLVVLAVYFLVPGWREQPEIAPLWRFLTFTLNFGEHAGEAFTHAWSLCVEEHFYLTLPVVIYLLRKKPRVWTACAVVAAIAVGGLVLRWELWRHLVAPVAGGDRGTFLFVYIKDIYYPTYARLDGLLAGVTLAAVQVFKPDWWSVVRRRGNVMLACGIAVLATSYPICRDIASEATAVWGYPMLALGFALLVAASTSEDSVLARWRVWGATAVATLAYSTYLTHKAVIGLDRRWMGAYLDAHVLVGGLIYLATVFAVATVLYLSVERPFLLLRERVGVERVARVGD